MFHHDEREIYCFFLAKIEKYAYRFTIHNNREY